VALLHVVPGFKDNWWQKKDHKKVIEMLGDLLHVDCNFEQSESHSAQHPNDGGKSRLLQILVLRFFK
jgi:hypothetical protein